MKKQTKQIRSASDLVGRKESRALSFERGKVDIEERTVCLAFAGETPCERSYGYEVLDCRESAIRMDRLKSGAPLLLGHDDRQQIGVVESVEIGADKVCRAVVRFGRSALATEILQDVEDGIRRNVSVGYQIHGAKLEEETDAADTYRITDWEPFEVSIVSMPADFKTAGVGRSAEEFIESKQENKKMADEKKDAPVAQTVDVEKIKQEARAAEMKRISDIRTVGDKFRHVTGIDDLVKKQLDAADGSVDALRAAILDQIEVDQKAEPTRRAGHVEYGQSARERLRYDKRSLQPFLRQAGGRVEVAERDAYEAGMWARATIFGDDVAAQWCRDNNLNLRVMTSGDNTAGGYLVPDSMENSIIDLRAEYGACRMLAEIVPMNSGTLPWPVRKTGTTAYFPGEETATTESEMSWGSVNLVAKDVSALTRLSNNLVEDAVIDIAAKVADEHAYAFAVKEDSCFIDGDGTSTYGGIVGLKAKLETASMAGIYTAASGSDTPAEIVAAELSGVMSKLPSYARKGANWLASPAFDELIFGRLMAAAGGNTTTTLAGAIVPAYLGKPRVVCEPCYSSATADMTGKAMLFYGNFRQGIAFGERRGIVVQVLRERYAEYRQIGVIGTERIDINCHGVGDTSNAGPIVALIGG